MKIRLADIDWNTLRQEAMQSRSTRRKTADDWDRKASSFAERNADSLYVKKFIELFDPKPGWSVLDVGSGPGTLALPLASQVKRVTALDFSPVMLGILREKAEQAQLTNVSTRTLSWSDDWAAHGLARHDAAIASRSLAVPDLRSAVKQLTRFARCAVAVTDRVGAGPFDSAAFAAVGRPFEPGPDYIYTVNLLHQMGIRATVDFIDLETEIPCASMTEAMEMFTWMFQDLTEAEKKRLKKYVQSITTTADNGAVTIHRRHTPTWAFIRWRP